ncbi:hypothetical protein [Endozoicomonas montiporae]|nr:hypothetical protein [Endozoicomonas montiporae]
MLNNHADLQCPRYIVVDKQEASKGHALLWQTSFRAYHFKTMNDFILNA